uniref:Uncharacterized protein n=1 Tax=Anguilla anguilla TaxID=7936 RepID=A0A0E9T6I2_ANGAN
MKIKGAFSYPHFL